MPASLIKSSVNPNIIYVFDVAIDAGGDVIAGGASLGGYKILKYDKRGGGE